MGKIKCCFLIVLFCMIFSQSAHAGSITSDQLINNPGEYDGKEVVFRGEVIGDVMKRGDCTWININDGSNAIGIWIPDNINLNISATGSYYYKGDVVEVHGIFNRACWEHGGDLDIHCTKIDVVERGHKVDRPVSQSKKIVSLVLLAVSTSLTLLIYRKRL